MEAKYIFYFWFKEPVKKRGKTLEYFTASVFAHDLEKALSLAENKFEKEHSNQNYIYVEYVRRELFKK